MDVTTLVLCPAAPGQPPVSWPTAPVESVELGPAAAADDDAWTAELALDLGRIPGPVALAAQGRAMALLPRLAFAARAARRPLRGYVLMGETNALAADRVTDWPDAPVLVVTTPGSELAAVARLRGWSVVGATMADLPLDAW